METTTTFCGNCGRAVAAQELVTLAGVPVCAQCKPDFLRRMQEGALAPVRGFAYQGFWIRFVAKILDGLVVTIGVGILYGIFAALFLGSLVGAPPSPQMLGAQLGIFALIYLLAFAWTIGYSTWMNGKWGATVGKMAIGAVIVNTDGTPIGYGKALGRAFAEILSGIIFYIGYIIAAFDPQKRALHDHICGTLVVARR